MERYKFRDAVFYGTVMILRIIGTVYRPVAACRALLREYLGVKDASQLKPGMLAYQDLGGVLNERMQYRSRGPTDAVKTRIMP